VATDRGQAHPTSARDGFTLVAPAALTAIAIAVLGKAAGSPPYLAVLGSLVAAAALLAALAWLRGPTADPFSGPLALKIGILAVTIFLQPSLVGRDPHFEVAVTERLIELGTWEPGLGFVSQKASGYAHYPGLSFVSATFSLLTGLPPETLAQLIPPMFTLVSLVLVVALAREVLDDDRLAAWVGIAWAAFSLTNVFQAEYVHESLGFLFFLTGIVLVFRYATADSPAPLAIFALVSGALVFTHHLSTAFLLVFLLLFVTVDYVFAGTGMATTTRRALYPVGLFAVFAVTYNLAFGDPSVFGQFESLVDTLTGPFSDQASQAPTGGGGGGGSSNATNASTGSPDPNVQEAVFYERRGRDVFIFNVRAVLTAALVALTLANVAWRGLHGSLDARRTSLLAWAGVVLGITVVVYVANVTIGLDAPRLLPWGYVFLIVLAADVPVREEVLASARDRLGSLHERVEDVAAFVPSAGTQMVGVAILLVVFAGFQLVTLPPHLLTEEEQSAYYRSQVRLYYHEDEQAMAQWVNDELDDDTPVFGDLTTYELVGPMDHGEVRASGSYVYSGDGDPVGETYVLWRQEMQNLYLGLDKGLALVFFPVGEDQQRTFEDTREYAQLYANPRTGVYHYGR
jgi:hypothetical protein